MFSTKDNILQLTSLMLSAGISKVVVCPGSRNAAVVHNFKAAGMECYEVTDERSAGFFALGLIEANAGRPVAVCCTSGSAVVNLAPAVVEAYYRPLPLFVVTADRPSMWIGQKDGQTMLQYGVFNDYVRRSVTLSEPKDDDDFWYCNRLINEAIIEMRKTGGPVHVNIPVTEPMFDFSHESLPQERVISLVSPVGNGNDFSLGSDVQKIISQANRPMIIIGQMLPEEMAECASLISIFARHGWVVLAENLSNIQIDDELRHLVVGNFDGLLAELEPEGPDVLVTLGGHIVSKRLKKYIRCHRPVSHIHVCVTGEVEDTYQSMTVLVQTSAQQFLKAAACHLSSVVSYCDEWRRDVKREQLPLLECLFSHLSPEWILQVANSSMVRKVQQVFSGCNPVYCNRGINGIEGSVSAAVGYWIGSKRPTMLLTGDLSFFYDQNGLWNKYVKAEQHNASLRIMIVNNGGGEIFYGLPGLSDSPYLSESIAASHTTSAKGIALECGCKYACVSSLGDFNSQLDWFLSDEKDVRILECINGRRGDK